MVEGRGERVTGTPDVTLNDPDDVVGGVAEGGGGGERATGTPTTIYNLSSVLFHALQGGASYDTYIEDAEQEGDEELTEFFRRLREEDRDRAAEARMLLAERTFTASRTEGATTGVSPGTEQIGSFPAEGNVPPTSREEAASPRPEPSDDFPGTEPIKGEDPTARSGEVPPPPEEVPSPRTEEMPEAEDVRSQTPPQAPPGDVQRETSGEARPRSEETPSRAGGASLDTPLSQEEMIRRQAERDRGEEDRGLTDEVRDAVFDEEGRRREGTGREDLR
jgi:hypothetical protein